MSNAKQLPMRDAQRIAESVVGSVDWFAEGQGYCPCPGRDLHQNHNGRRDCRVSLASGRAADGRVVAAPTISCFHSSCAAVIEIANRRLRSELGKAEQRFCHGGHRRRGAPPKTQEQPPRRPPVVNMPIKPADVRSRAAARMLRMGFHPPDVCITKRGKGTYTYRVSENPSEPSGAERQGGGARED